MLLVSVSLLLAIVTKVYTANPENATCSPTSIISDLITIDCSIYPSCRIEDIGLRINNKTFPSSTDDKELQIKCRSLASGNGQLYYTTKCSIGINLTIFTPGDNQISVTVSGNDTENIFNITSNHVTIPLFDDLQVPTCSQPDITFDGKSITMDCLSQLYYKNVSCSLIKRTPWGIYTRTIASVAGERILDKNETFGVRCYFKIMPSDMGVGRHQLMVTLSSTNGTGDDVSASTNWTDPINFFLPYEMNFTVNGNPEGVVANVGDNVTFYCSVNGFPAPTMSIERDEPTLTGFGIIFIQNETYSFIVSSCRNAGIYNCSYAGHLGSSLDAISKKFYVNIPCPLMSILDRNLDSSYKYLGEFRNTSSVNFDVFGYPGPKSMNIFKTRYYDKFLSSDSVNISYRQGYGPHGSIAVKFINTDLIRDLQDFTVKVDNGVGNTTFRFAIQAVGQMSSYGSTTSIWLSFVYIMSRFII